jgi:hypothetical protein
LAQALEEAHREDKVSIATITRAVDAIIEAARSAESEHTRAMTDMRDRSTRSAQSDV